MNRSLHVSVARGRKMAGWVCLLAVMLLWAPLWAAALEASAMGCCADGFCGRATHEHQKTNQAVAVHTAPAETPMECEHHGGPQNKPGAMKCSISCCHQNEASLTRLALFLLRVPSALCGPAEVQTFKVFVAPVAFVPSLEPLSPPPRSLSLL